MFESIMRHMLLGIGKSPAAGRLAKRYGLKLGAARFVAGRTIEEAITAVQGLNAAGKLATLDHLGEYVAHAEDAAASAEMCIRTLDEIAASGVQSNLSLKLTSLGLDLEEGLCLGHMQRIVSHAGKTGNFVRIDMEDYAHCEPTLDLYRELRKTHDNVGVVIQAYLRRAPDDIRELGSLRANMRLVKGAYKEPETVAYPRKSDVDKQFLELIQLQLTQGYTAIATHDRSIIEASLAFIEEQRISKDCYEFQMLYGIGEDLQDALVRDGHRVRVYVPFGEDWFGYFMRRLAERPANVGFILKNMRRARGSR
ncbi:proline dehydrogenase family protein [Paenibacillus daejeonensis]|uniref:proline dehydrogenase family protein n=1 Tax=Paenibacillus daejeonensis TaxID=135193 RepID=UPI000363F4B2|nr:proline dehydrogenase family protein [Paenibacillus daejeonensis]